MTSTTRCPACGMTYTSSARFCPKDGTRLLTASGPVPKLPTAPGGGRAGELPRPAASDTPGLMTPIPAAPPLGGRTGEVRPIDPSRSGPPAGTRRSPPGAPERKRADPAALAGSVLDRRYHIVKKVGEGGMSFVYLAHDITTSERLAIKVLSPSLAEDRNAVQRLKREAGMGLRLEHPHVCHIVRFGETDDGLVYLVMPFLEGELLCDRTNRLGRIPLDETVRLVRQIADGLAAAHALKIIHRDLKPENVMICRDAEGSERAVVMDFGLAKERPAGAELEKLTATGIILGTPEFMSPEQIRGKPLDPRSDVYALGLMTFEMLTGRLPFGGKTQQEKMIARLRSDPVSLKKIRPDLDLPEALEGVFERCLHRDPAARYQTAPEFAASFARAAAGEREPEGGGEGGLLGRFFGR